MILPDDNFESNLPPLEDDYTSDETTLEEFFDKVKIEENKEVKKVIITKAENNSGSGEEPPESISHKFNWGAFLFNWLWGLKYKQFALLAVPVLLFVPYGWIPAFLVSVWAGINGNKWAWKEIEYKNEEDFHIAQKAWVKWWLIFTAGIICLCLAVWFSLPKKQKKDVSSQMTTQSYSFFNSKELNIPQEVYDNTTPKDKYSNFLMSDKYVIYWLRPKNEFTENNAKYILDKMEAEKDTLRDKFIVQPDLVEIKSIDGKIVQNEQINKNPEKPDVKASCENGDVLCFEAWLYKTCNNGYCIINPKTKKYYKVKGKENIIPKAEKTLKVWQ